MLGSIEAGGTKFVCAVGNYDYDIIDKVNFPTTSPRATMQKIASFFSSFRLNSIGVGSFGPIDMNSTSRFYGYIRNTPKQEWTNFNFLGELKQLYNIPIGWTTDVNIASLGELVKGAGKGSNNVLYITVGTGIGGGFSLNHKTFGENAHPEMGHILVNRHPLDKFKGACPYHNDCLEGLASGSAIESRVGKKAYNISNHNIIWEFLSYYLSQALYNYSLTLRPDIIVLGGGVMKNEKLFLKTKEKLNSLIDNYIQTPPISEYVVPPLLKDQSGIVGGLILANNERNKSF